MATETEAMMLQCVSYGRIPLYDMESNGGHTKKQENGCSFSIAASIVSSVFFYWLLICGIYDENTN